MNLTFVLALVALGAVVYAVGLDTTKQATVGGARTAKRVGQTTTARATAGFLGGIAIAEQLALAAMMEPFAVTTILAGIGGALGIEGMLGGISGLQYLLIGVTLFAGVVIYRRVS